MLVTYNTYGYVYQALCPLIDTDRRIPAEIQLKQERKRKV